MNVPETEPVWMCQGCQRPVRDVHGDEEWRLYWWAHPEIFSNGARASWNNSHSWLNLHVPPWDYIEFRPTNISLCVGEMR